MSTNVNSYIILCKVYDVLNINYTLNVNYKFPSLQSRREEANKRFSGLCLTFPLAFSTIIPPFNRWHYYF